MRFFLVEWLQNSRWSIRAKLMGGFFVIVLFLLILTALSIWTTDHQGQKILQVKSSQEEAFGVLQVSHSLVDLENRLTNIQNDLSFIYFRAAEVVNNKVSPDEAYFRSQASLADFDRQKEAIQQNLLVLDRLPEISNISDTDKNNWSSTKESLKNDIRQLLDSLSSVRQAAGQQQFKTVNDGWTQAGNSISLVITRAETFRTRLNGLLEQTIDSSRQAAADADGLRNLSQIIILIAGLLAIGLTILFGLVLTQVFITPVNRLRHRLLHLADGDLSTNLALSNQDQFGELANTFNQSMDRLGSMVGQVQRQAHKVSNAAEEIAEASSHSAQISVEQAGAVTQATVTIEELSHTAQQIAEAATLVASAAEQALASVNEGQDTAQESIKGNTNLKLRVREITDRILALSERSQRVGHIIEQVASIADQTHLLALNAAIESAAAGENGKRFAVVASEVKRLADRSRQATKDVQAVLGEIQDATNASVMATEQGLKEAERGVILAYRAGDVNESIIQMVERTVQLANAISLATQQQRSASEQVVTSMRHLSTVIGDAAASANQSSALAASLDLIALELARVSGQFKLPANQTLDEPPSGDITPGQLDAASTFEGSSDLRPFLL
jgi:methyl-accepting chemotaxis protein